MNGFFYNKTKLVLTILLSLYITHYAYKKMYNWLLAKEEQKALKTYIENWEVNQKDKAIKLQPLLHDLYTKYKQNQNQVDFAEMARMVKVIVNAQKARDQQAKNVIKK